MKIKVDYIESNETLEMRKVEAYDPKKEEFVDMIVNYGGRLLLPF